MYDNELVHQKNAILDLIHSGQYETALMLLAFSEELWAAASYAYKTRELRQIIKDEARRLMLEAGHWKTEEKWKKLHDSIPS